MTVKHLTASLVYSVGEIGQGLLLHPYQTMQNLQQEKVFSWMTLFPTAILAIITLLWRFGVVPLVRLFFSCSNSGFWGCNGAIFMSDWITFFCIYWQILLLYLFFRFSKVIGNSSTS